MSAHHHSARVEEGAPEEGRVAEPRGKHEEESPVGVETEDGAEAVPDGEAASVVV